jgi:hypothetical protein
VASIHIFMFDDGCSATIAATRVPRETRLTQKGAASRQPSRTAAAMFQL